MIIQYVRFQSSLSQERVRQVMQERAPMFRAVPGLLQKYYTHDPASGDTAAVYFWDSEESLRTYRDTELARSIPAAYQVVAPPRVEILEVVLQLRDKPVGEESAS